MGDVVNLNRARKAKAKKVATAQAAANRLSFGRTKQEKAADKARREREKNALDGLLCADKHGPTSLDLDQCE